MEADGVDYSVLYPMVGAGGEVFGRITDPQLELACVQAYNDWVIETWASVSDRFRSAPGKASVVPARDPESCASSPSRRLGAEGRATAAMRRRHR